MSSHHHSHANNHSIPLTIYRLLPLLPQSTQVFLATFHPLGFFGTKATTSTLIRMVSSVRMSLYQCTSCCCCTWRSPKGETLPETLVLIEGVRAAPEELRGVIYLLKFSSNILLHDSWLKQCLHYSYCFIIMVTIMMYPHDHLWYHAWTGLWSTNAWITTRAIS